MSRTTSPCISCAGRVWLSTDRLGRTIEACTGPRGYTGTPRPSGTALKPADEERERAQRRAANKRYAAKQGPKMTQSESGRLGGMAAAAARRLPPIDTRSKA